MIGESVSNLSDSQREAFSRQMSSESHYRKTRVVCGGRLIPCNTYRTIVLVNIENSVVRTIIDNWWSIVNITVSWKTIVKRKKEINRKFTATFVTTRKRNSVIHKRSNIANLPSSVTKIRKVQLASFPVLSANVYVTTDKPIGKENPGL